MRQAESGPTLPVSDMLLRQLIRSGQLNAAISLPYFSTIRVEHSSGIQGYREQTVQLSQQLDLHLRRLLYYETWAPEQCREIVENLANGLCHNLLPIEIGELAAELLELGRSKGWIKDY